MSTAKKEVDPLHVLRVSARDRAIYQAVQIGGKQQRVVALEYKLSQPRVSAIIKRVTRWLSQGDPPGLGELYRRDRLRAVSRLHRMRLEQRYQEAVTAWQKSDQPTRSIKEREVKGVVVLRETVVHTKQLDMRYLDRIQAISDRITAFEGFDDLGNVDQSCTGRIYEEPERSPVEACREVKRRTIAGGFDTPGDEGIPGMWGEEMERRNAALAGKRESGDGVRGSGIGVRGSGDGVRESGVIAERQLGELSLSSVLRGEGRDEGPAPREEPATSAEREEITTEYRPNTPPMSATIPPILSERKEQNPTQVLSKKLTDSSQVTQQQAIATFTPPEKALSNNPPKVPRVRLMGTAAQMAECESFEEYYSPERRAGRAFERAMAGPTQGNSQGPPLSPGNCSEYREYRGEGGRLLAPTIRRTITPSQHPSIPTIRRTHSA